VIPVIAIGFALLGGLVLWFVVGSRGAWWLKLPVIVVTTMFTFVVWHALDSFSGWPTDATPPARAVLVSSMVDEPNAIYVWLIGYDGGGAFGYRPHDLEPRGYKLPYTRALHAEIDRASALARQGRRVELRRRTSLGRPNTHPGRPAVSIYVMPLTPGPLKLPADSRGRSDRFTFGMWNRSAWASRTP
jgi:hypothetical protein